jgi:hypothetical protein
MTPSLPHMEDTRMSARIFIIILLPLCFYGSVYSQIVGVYPEVDILNISGGCMEPEIEATILQGMNSIDTIRIWCFENGYCFWRPVFIDSIWNYWDSEYFENINFLVKDSLDQYRIELWCEFPETGYPGSPMQIPLDTPFAISWGGDFSITLRMVKENEITFFRKLDCSAQWGDIKKEKNDCLCKFYLYSNYPNPFNPTTTIKFSVDKNEYTSLKIFDITGRDVALLISEKLNPGTYSTQWNASTMPSGVYFCLLRSGLHAESRKLILIK